MKKVILILSLLLGSFTVGAMQQLPKKYSEEASYSLGQAFVDYVFEKKLTYSEFIQKVKSALSEGANPDLIPKKEYPGTNNLSSELIIEPLVQAVRMNDRELVKILLDAGANPNKKILSPKFPDQELPHTPVLTQVKDFAMGKLLISAGANPTDALSNALERTNTSQDLHFLKFLISQGADVDSTVKPGLSALSDAVMFRNPQTIRILLEAGADPNLTYDSINTTPLMAAVTLRKIDAIRLLLENGAKLDIKNSQGQTALDLAIKQNAGHDIEVLLRNPPAVRKLGLKKAL